MKQLFRQDSKEIIVLSLFYILMGVAFMVLNVHILSTAVRIIGGILIAIGIGNLAIPLLTNSFDASILIIVIPCILLGSYLTGNPAGFLSACSRIIGLVMVFNGILHLSGSHIYRVNQYPRWVGNLLYAMIVLVIGIVLVVHPIESVRTVMRFGGILLIIEGVFTLLGHRSYRKHCRDNNIIEGEYIETKEETHE